MDRTHPVSYLQELMARAHGTLPIYNMVQSHVGFTCTVSVLNITASATASTKQAAKLQAATKAVLLLKEKCPQYVKQAVISSPGNLIELEPLKSEINTDSQLSSRVPDEPSTPIYNITTTTPNNLSELDMVSLPWSAKVKNDPNFQDSLFLTISKHPVSELQEFMAKLKKPTPTYNITDISVPNYPYFRCTLFIEGLTFVSEATSKQTARKEAADKALKQLKGRSPQLEFECPQSILTGIAGANSINNLIESVPLKSELGMDTFPCSVKVNEDSYFRESPITTIGKHPVSELQELMAKRKKPTPTYNIVDISTPHSPCFRCTLFVEDLSFVSEGTSKQLVRKEAADKALKQLKCHSPKVEFEATPKSAGLLTEHLSIPTALAVASSANNLVKSEPFNSELDMDTLPCSIKVESESNYQDSPPLTMRKHPISELQELMAKQRKPAPVYNIEDISTQNSPYFRCTLLVRDLTFISEATSKQIARKVVADKALKQIQQYSQDIDSTSLLQSENSFHYNTIGTLNEFLQKRNASVADYVELGVNGKGEFICACKAGGNTTHGYGVNKKLAKKDAAYKMVELLNVRHVQPTPVPIIKPTKFVDDEAVIKKFNETKNDIEDLIESQQNLSISDPIDPIDTSSQDMLQTKAQLIEHLNKMKIPYSCSMVGNNRLVQCIHFNDGSTYLGYGSTSEEALIDALRTACKMKFPPTNNNNTLA